MMTQTHRLTLAVDRPKKPGVCVVCTNLMLNVALLRLRSNRLDALPRTFLNSLCSQVRRWIWVELLYNLPFLWYQERVVRFLHFCGIRVNRDMSAAW